jgi:hypothetical protein
LGLRSVFFSGARADLVFTGSVFLALVDFARSILLVSFSRIGWSRMLALLRPRSERLTLIFRVTRLAIEGDGKANGA